MELPADSVRSVEAIEGAQVTERGEVRFPDPNRTRYFYTPSGMMLKAGEGYFSQKELVFSSVAYGITDNLSIVGGAVIPAWFAGTSGLNVIAGLKFGGTVIEDRLHLAIGAETLVLPAVVQGVTAGGGLLFGTATFGNRDAHFSIAAGKPFFFSSGGTGAGDFIVTVSGNLRVAKSVALVTENWFMPSAGTTTVILAPGVRIMGEKIAVDIGGVWLLVNGSSVTAGIPIPWLDFTYNFG